MKLFFDTETTGLEGDASMLQIAAVLCDDDLTEVAALHAYVDSTASVPLNAFKIHGISTDMIKQFGIRPRSICSIFYGFALRAHEFVCHNFEFDDRVVGHAFDTVGIPDRPWRMADKIQICTMKCATPACKIPHPRFSGDYKWPTLGEACFKFKIERPGRKLHDAMSDVRDTIEIYRWLHEHDFIKALKPRAQAVR